MRRPPKPSEPFGVDTTSSHCLDRRWERTVPLTAAPAPPHIIVEGGRLADTLARAVELAEEVKWDAAGKAQGERSGTGAP